MSANGTNKKITVANALAGKANSSHTHAQADVTDLTTDLAAKAADADVVHDTGNETIAGVKTFSSSPIVPAPTTDLQAATKKYVDDNSGGASTLSGLSDVDDTVGTPSDGDIIVYRSAGSDWVLEAKPAGGSNPAVADITDVSITSVADNEVLAYDNGTSEWVNQTAAEAGLAAASHTHTESQITDLHTHANKAVLDATTASFLTTDETKLDGIEASADVTDAANVAAAGAVMNTGAETIAGVKTFSSDPIIPDEVYGAGWNGSLEPPTKNAVYDKIETISVSGMTDPMTTEGDIIYRNATVPARLAKGTAGQVLTMNAGATAPEWATAAGGSSTPRAVRFFEPLSTVFWNDSVGSGGTITYDDGGYTRLAANTTSGGNVSLAPAANHAHLSKGTVFRKVHGSVAIGIAGGNGNGNAYFHFLSTNNNFATMTADQVGYKMIKTAGTTVTSASNGDGTTETATAVNGSFSVALTSRLVLNVVCDDGVNNKFYEAGTLLATHTTNLQGNTSTDFYQYPMSMLVNNAATTDTFVLDFMYGSLTYEMF
jgi:hypothetical protein